MVMVRGKYKGLLLLLCLVTGVATAKTKHSKKSLYMSYKGLVMTGYQGWFNTPGDGAGKAWMHYSKSSKFEQGSVIVDMWPDVSEYKKTYKTSFVMPNGKPAHVFSSYDPSTINLHFKWMKDYGIDGAFVQRFVTHLKSKKYLNHKNVVLKSALNAASQNKRAISVMYDFSGMHEKDVDLVINDWKYLVDSLKLTSGGKNQTYLYHNAKPLVALWGVGFNDGRKYSLNAVKRIVDFLKNDPVYGNCSVLLGVPTYWREQREDAVSDPEFIKICKSADIIHPWFVGRYNENSYANFKPLLEKDIIWCKENGVDYVPVVFPGFSWHNMHPESPSNHIPRNRGNFFWKQIAGAIEEGAEMLYVAMFDELDEATAIFKIEKNPPVGKNKFVTYESDIPNDYYLFLTGYAGRILKKEIPFQIQKPFIINNLNIK